MSKSLGQVGFESFDGEGGADVQDGDWETLDQEVRSDWERVASNIIVAYLASQAEPTNTAPNKPHWVEGESKDGLAALAKWENGG